MNTTDSAKVEYKTNVDKIKIEPEDIDGLNAKYRYKLTIPFKKKENKLVVLMMNPSKATDKNSDTTVNIITKYASNQGYAEVQILNAIPFYETDSSKLNSILIKQQNEDPDELCKIIIENNTIIKNVLNEENSDIIVATGEPKGKLVKMYMNNVYKLLKGKNFRYIAKNENNYYRHPTRIYIEDFDNLNENDVTDKLE